MRVFEEKINTCLEWILADSAERRGELAERAATLLQQNTKVEATFVLEDCVTNLLKELGVGPALLGFDYLACAVALAVEDDEYLRQVTKRLYPEVAKRFDATDRGVERAMRHGIERAFNQGGYDALESLFGSGISSEKGKATNSEFVAACVREVRRRMRNGN